MPLLVALFSALASTVFVEVRHPLRIASGGWLWTMRAIHVASFFVLALLAVALVLSYI